MRGTEANFSKETIRSKEKIGRGIEEHILFVRHGEKGAGGELSEQGKVQAKEYGEGMEKKDAVKGYASPVQRVVETVEGIVANAPHDTKLTLRKRVELGIPKVSAPYLKKWKELESQDPNLAAEWAMQYRGEGSDPETTPLQETAETFAHILSRYIAMADRLYSGSKIDIINGTHFTLPEALLKEIMIREVDGEKVVGFDTLAEIGGGLQPTEAIDFVVTIDETGQKNVRMNFRNQLFEIDKDRLQELHQAYIEKHKK